jgi:uncharacterized membrane protein HdeD (DUF308 family)
MIWALLALGIFLLLSGILGQVYSLKTKRGVLPPETRVWRVAARMALFLAGLLLIATAVARIVLHHGAANQ